MPTLDHSELRGFAEQLLAKGGMSPDDAKLVADLLVKADLRGYAGHGVTRIPSYLSWIKDSTINPRNPLTIERQGKISAMMDAHHAIGQVAACRAMELALQKAREHGAGIVCVRRAGHTGRLADYMEMATDAGCIGIGAVSVGSGSTTLYGGIERVTGTNPIAFGIPGRNGRAIILDFATAAMSMGEIQKRVARKEPIPAGVMLDGKGNPTTDFKVFRGPPRGVFLPFGGYKGSGVALVAEILGGILTGNGLGRDWWERGGHGVNGLFLQAIDLQELQPLELFFTEVDRLIAAVKAMKAAPGHSEIFLPGERGRQIEDRQRRHGVAIDDSTWAQLRELAAIFGVAAPDIRRPAP